MSLPASGELRRSDSDDSHLAADVPKSDKKDSPWYATTHIPTDLSVHIDETTFTVHKRILLAKCGYAGLMSSTLGYEVKLQNFPGGAETFQAVLKFCYGLQLDLKASNIASLRCAAEFLEMSEEKEDGNLVSKTESFFTFMVLSSWKDTIAVLKSCESLSPWVENLQIVRRCCDSIAWKASRNHFLAGEVHVAEDWWCADVTSLRIDHFGRILTAMSAKGTEQDRIVRCVMQYADRWIGDRDGDGDGDGDGEGEGNSNLDELEQRNIIENLVGLLPIHETVPCEFLSRVLKFALAYSASPALISELEKRVGMRLVSATVKDLMIPNREQMEQSTAHNMDVVQRIVEYFLMHEHEHQNLHPSGNYSVCKLMDGYLLEMARDPNLSVTKFQVLAEALPENLRKCDDGLYRAIDAYIRSHPWLSEHDLKRLCRLLNCDKLSVEASSHAAQNERLPIRISIQVLFAQQIKIMATVQKRGEQRVSGENLEIEGNDSALRDEVIALREELENVKNRMVSMQRDHTILMHQCANQDGRQRHAPGWNFSWKKLRRSSLFFHRKNFDEASDESKERPSLIPRSQRRRQSVS